MPDCFITYASGDEELATWVTQYLKSRGPSVFMARLSLRPGEDWTETIWNNLRASQWIIFLASRQACSSAYVQQEVGGALFGGKTLVPVVWNMDPSELPGWAGCFQALDLRGLSVDGIVQQIERIAVAIHGSKQKGALIVGGIIAALLLLASAGKD
jgi:hypothetical protein